MNTEVSIIILLTVALFSCNKRSEKNVNSMRPGKSQMTELNSYLVQKDRERIQNYIERKNLNMRESATGLWYMVIKEGSGKYFKDNDRITMDYRCSLLDGSLCYSSKTLGPKEIVLGKSELETGLNEGIRLLKPGGEATFILPPFLAYGLTGDSKAVPPRAIIVYEIKVSEIK
jgi:FKBP-type peptidyl-prolyl cis-trans isomerase